MNRQEFEEKYLNKLVRITDIDNEHEMGILKRAGDESIKSDLYKTHNRYVLVDKTNCEIPSKNGNITEYMKSHIKKIELLERGNVNECNNNIQ